MSQERQDSSKDKDVYGPNIQVNWKLALISITLGFLIIGLCEWLPGRMGWEPGYVRAGVSISLALFTLVLMRKVRRC